jgi:hypothetical protein
LVSVSAEHVDGDRGAAALVRRERASDNPSHHTSRNHVPKIFLCHCNDRSARGHFRSSSGSDERTPSIGERSADASGTTAFGQQHHIVSAAFKLLEA